MEKLYQQFKNEHPETVGEKDKHFDLSNYKDWLEKKHIELLSENNELMDFIKSIQCRTQQNSIFEEIEQLINKLTK